MAGVLIIDDDQQLCEMLAKLIQQMGHQAHRCFTLKDGLKRVREEDYDVVFLDVKMPDGSGLNILPKIRETPSAPEVVIMTGFGDADGAETAIKNGAWDYLQKPLLPKNIMLPIKRVLKYREDLRKKIEKTPALKIKGIVGKSPGIKACLDAVAQTAGTDTSVLIYGETGTGKELFARAIHDNSDRALNNFVVVDCAALPETLVESTLFGHRKGAFTSANHAHQGLVSQADGGTLFLDEIGELPLSIQKSFLRVLQEKRFRPVGSNTEITSDFRLIAATNRPLEKMIELGGFRSDLFHRIKSFIIELPPLRERRQDIKDLITFHMKRICDRAGFQPKEMTEDFLQCMTAYGWPGNVRELAHAVESALTAAQYESVLIPRHLPPEIRIQVKKDSLVNQSTFVTETSPAETGKPVFPTYGDFREALLAEGEKKYFMDLMKTTKGSIKSACKLAGLSRSRLYVLMKKNRISRFGWEKEK